MYDEVLFVLFTIFFVLFHSFFRFNPEIFHDFYQKEQSISSQQLRLYFIESSLLLREEIGC